MRRRTRTTTLSLASFLVASLGILFWGIIYTHPDYRVEASYSTPPTALSSKSDLLKGVVGPSSQDRSDPKGLGFLTLQAPGEAIPGDLADDAGTFESAPSFAHWERARLVSLAAELNPLGMIPGLPSGERETMKEPDDDPSSASAEAKVGDPSEKDQQVNERSSEASPVGREEPAAEVQSSQEQSPDSVQAPSMASSEPSSAGPALKDPTNEQISALSLAPLEAMMLQAIEVQRGQAGLAPFQVDNRLVPLARQRSWDMAEKGYFAHVGPDGSSARSLMTAHGIGPGIMGEILGRNNSPDLGQSVASVVEAFMNSPSHRSTILNARFVRAGLGVATDSGNMRYYTILFLGP